MSIAVEGLFTTAPGLQAPWVVSNVDLNTVKRRLDFDVVKCDAKKLPCPACGVDGQGVHDRVKRSWRHSDFFQFEAWLHTEVPRVDCSACGKATQAEVPWARSGRGFTLLFEALALSLCQTLPVAQAANQLRVQSKRLWRRIEHDVGIAHQRDEMTGVRVVGIDETSFKEGHNYIDCPELRPHRARHARLLGTLHSAASAAEHGGFKEARTVAALLPHWFIFLWRRWTSRWWSRLTWLDQALAAGRCRCPPRPSFDGTYCGSLTYSGENHGQQTYPF